MPLKMVRGNLVDMRTDAIVNAANTGLKQGGGVCGAIFEAAGAAAMRKACDLIGGCATGEAVITPGFRLRAKYVIHTPGPVWAGGTHGEAELLAACYRNALALAQQRGLSSIAFPLISAGVYGYPADQALHVAVRAIGDYLLTHDELEVYLVQYGQAPNLPDGPMSRTIWKYLRERKAQPRPRVPETTPQEEEAVRQEILDEVMRHTRAPQAEAIDGPASRASGADGCSGDRPAENQEESPHFAKPAGQQLPEGFAQATDQVFEFRCMPAPEASEAPKPASARKKSLLERLDSLHPLQKRIHNDQQRLYPAPASAQPDSAASVRHALKASTGMPSVPAARDDFFGSQGWQSSEPMLTRWEEQTRVREARQIADDLNTARQASTDAMRRNIQRLALESVLLEKQEPFSEAVLRRIDEMHLKDPVVYKRANLDRKLFSKLRNTQSYSPSRRTALSLCIALELTLNEAYDLLSRAGYTLSVASDADLIIAYFIEHEWYDIFDLNEALFTFNQRCLGV